MNHSFDRIKFIETSLKYIFQPFKNYYDLNNSTSSLVSPKDNEIDEIIKRLDYFFICDNLLEIFLKMKIKELILVLTKIQLMKIPYCLKKSLKLDHQMILMNQKKKFKMEKKLCKIIRLKKEI